MTDLNPRIDANAQREADALLEFSQRIQAHPEVLFEELHASAWPTVDQ